MRIYNDIQENLKAHPKSWLVTGVAGFIGSNLLKKLLDLKQHVVGIDNFATGYKENIQHVLKSVGGRPSFSFVKGDVCALKNCLTVTRDVHYVLHQAALGSIPRSIANPLATNDANVKGFLNVLFASHQNKVQRVVYASSSSVYGDSTVLPRTEEVMGNQISPYAVSKYTMELYARAFAHCYQMETIGLRYFNVFGPYQNLFNPYAAVIPIWIKNLHKNEPCYINGDGTGSRDFCYIDNVVQANILSAVINNPDITNNVYNIAVGERTNLIELFTLLCSALGVSSKVLYREQRPGDVPHSHASIEKAKRLLGYAPSVTIKEGLQKMVVWLGESKWPLIQF